MMGLSFKSLVRDITGVDPSTVKGSQKDIRQLAQAAQYAQSPAFQARVVEFQEDAERYAQMILALQVASTLFLGVTAAIALHEYMSRRK